MIQPTKVCSMKTICRKLVVLVSLLFILPPFLIAYTAQADEVAPSANSTDSTTLDMLFNNSYQVFKDLRNDKGIYRDSVLLTNATPYHPSSVAASGIGLFSEAIAAKKGWEPDALANVKKTISTMTGNTSGFNAERTANGYYRHFINMDTGAREWNSEFSTVDTAIFVTGSLFAAKYFNDPELNAMVSKLYHSIDFGAAIADPDTGGIYMIMNADGTGDAKAITLPYNEYIVVAWLAYNQNIDNPQSKAVQLWNNKFADTDNLLTAKYKDIDLLTDNSDHYLSSFTVLFPYYMVNMFSKSDGYRSYMANAYKADKLWSEEEGADTYEWGNGAGAAPAPVGYHADSINNNEFRIISPQIISGFLPINPSGKQDLLNIYSRNKGVYSLQSDQSTKILWRYSLSQPEWQPDSVQAIDYSTMLFGLATQDKDLGTAFFQNNNNFYTTVSFDLNGGGGAPPAAKHLVSTDTLEEPTKPSRSGYSFVGWNTAPDGSGTQWDFSANSPRNKDFTLFAQWRAVNIHSVAFDLNGGSGEAPVTQRVPAGGSVQEPSRQPVRTGYRFVGWSEERHQEGARKYWNFATDVLPDKDMVLYAQWVRDTLPETGQSSVPLVLMCCVLLSGAALLLGLKKKHRSR